MNPRWLVKMALWVRNPPSKRHQWIVGITFAIAAILYGIEHFFGWPEALTVNKTTPKGLRN